MSTFTRHYAIKPLTLNTHQRLPSTCLFKRDYKHAKKHWTTRRSNEASEQAIRSYQPASWVEEGNEGQSDNSLCFALASRATWIIINCNQAAWNFTSLCGVNLNRNEFAVARTRNRLNYQSHSSHHDLLPSSSHSMSKDRPQTDNYRVSIEGYDANIYDRESAELWKMRE